KYHATFNKASKSHYKNNKTQLMKKAIYLVLAFYAIFLISAIQLKAQDKPKKEVYKLTHHMSPEEKARFYLVGKGYKGTDPPPGQVRNIAEFEQMEGVLIRYPFGISYSLIAGLSEETMVTTIVEDQGEENYVTSQYQSYGVNMANCNFIHALSDSYWTRDYGPWYIAYGEDQIGIVDFIYNRPDRPHDDAIPEAMAGFLGIDWFGMDLIHTGGNYMTDGYGISSSTELVWDENPTMTHEEINQMMYDYLGIETYYVVPDPNNNYIDHIDCWGKFLDVDKILIREVPSTHPQYDEIEATAVYYASQISSYGLPYQVYRVWTPNNEPYTNSLILNDRVFVPITGYQWDDEAITSYEQAMPGYEVLGFTGSWASTDALHCRTKGIADRNMLYIKHFPLLGDQPIQTEYLIEAELTAYNGQPIINDSVKVIYWINGGSSEEIVMTYEGDKLYSAVIPGPPEGSEIAYYIHAVDESDKSANHPFIGTPDPHTFYVGQQFFPSIALNVTEINAWANQGYTTVEEFIISNNGQIDLNYLIEWSTAVFEDYDYEVDDSPSQSSWNYNTYTEFGWTDLEINDEGEIANWAIEYTWQTDNWLEEGSFHVESPLGTQAIIAAGINNGTYIINLDAFSGEEMLGNWKLWIQDTYGDGGHKASNITVTVTKSDEIVQWMDIDPTSGSVEPGGQDTIQVTCDATELPVGDYEGTIYITSNDPDQSIIEIPVYFTVDYASGTEDISKSDIQILNYPNPFSNQTFIEIILPERTSVLLEIYNYNGQKVRTLNSKELNAGLFQFTWKGTNDNGNRVKSGVYFYKLSTGNFEQINKLILLE
ncbi:MAG: agmatine deiminase family protein, partial [Bacteroidales bacterium]|nr:agmatine deiminase family protein [Bacteroidales bacterium]